MQRSISNLTDGHRQLRPTRLATVQTSLRELFTGTSGPRDGDDQLEGPKTPRVIVQPTRTRLSHASPPAPVPHTLTSPVPLVSPVSPVSPVPQNIPHPSPTSTRPITPESFARFSRALTVPPQAYHTEPRQSWGVSPNVQQPVASVEEGSRWLRRGRVNWKTKGPLWFPSIKEPAIRSKLTCCFVSGCLLVIILSLCKCSQHVDILGFAKKTLQTSDSPSQVLPWVRSFTFFSS
jgi:hypothetical protein